MNSLTLNQRTGFDAPDTTYTKASDFYRDRDLLEAYLKLKPITISRADQLITVSTTCHYWNFTGLGQATGIYDVAEVTFDLETNTATFGFSSGSQTCHGQQALDTFLTLDGNLPLVELLETAHDADLLLEDALKVAILGQLRPVQAIAIFRSDPNSCEDAGTAADLQLDILAHTTDYLT